MNPLSLTKLEVYGIGGLVALLAAFGWGVYEKHEGRVEGRAEVQVTFDKFRNDVTAAGLKSQQDALNKEKEYATNLTTARTERDSALTRLQVANARPRAGFVSAPAGPSEGDRRVCYDRATLDGALRALDKGVSGLVGEGDTAVINALSLLRAWPH